MIVERYRELTAPSPEEPEVSEKRIFINAEPTPAWRSVARRICAELTETHKISCLLLGDPSETQEERSKNREYCLVRCDALLFVGGSNPRWFDEEREAYRKTKLIRKRAKKSPEVPMALCDVPPASGPDEGVAARCFWCDPNARQGARVAVQHRPTGVKVIDCSAGDCSQEGRCVQDFQEFVRQFLGEGA